MVVLDGIEAISEVVTMPCPLSLAIISVFWADSSDGSITRPRTSSEAFLLRVHTPPLVMFGNSVVKLDG